jgi:hypothetical protein
MIVNEESHRTWWPILIICLRAEENYENPKTNRLAGPDSNQKPPETRNTYKILVGNLMQNAVPLYSEEIRSCEGGRVDGTVSGSCPVEGFRIIDGEISDYITGSLRIDLYLQ